MSIPDVFNRIIAALDDSQIPYMLTGSFAGSYYGAPRTTQDIDFVIDPTDEQLRTLRRRRESRFQGITLYIVSPEDAILSKLEWAKRANSRRQIEDVAAILRIRWDSIDRSYLERWIAGLEVSEQWQSAKHFAGLAQ